jgi:hypothetical protein
MSDVQNDRDDRLAGLLTEALESVRDHRTIDVAAWQARHPDLADELPELLDTLRRLDTAAADWKLIAGPETPPPPASLVTVPTADPSPPRPLPERIGRYRILRVLGEGGMGTVYQAEDPQLQRVVALKVPRFDGPERCRVVAMRRFQREARAAAQIRHPHVCPIHDVGSHEGFPYVVMDYVEGESLADRLGARGRYEEPAEAVRVVLEITEALEAVHAKGVVHRDLKPGNILITPAGKAVLTDFGLARWEQDGETLTTDGALLGTPAYMSPEQAALDAEPVGPWSDVFSLGVVLYQMLTGRLPFEGPALKVVYSLAHESPPPLRLRRADLDLPLEGIVLKAMARRRTDRYSSARQFADALRHWSAEAPGEAHPGTALAQAVPAERDEGKASTPRPGAGRRRRLLAVGCLLFFFLPFLLWGGSRVMRRGPQEAAAPEAPRREEVLREEDRLAKAAAPPALAPVGIARDTPAPAIPAASANNAAPRATAPSTTTTAPTLPHTVSLEEQLLKQAAETLDFLRGKGCKTVGVLKFRVSKLGASLSGPELSMAPIDSAGPLNQALATRLELALALANDDKNPIGVLHDASQVADLIPKANHLYSAGRKALFGPTFLLAWGKDDTPVAADAFVTGAVRFSPNLDRMGITLLAFCKDYENVYKQDEFYVNCDGDLLVEAGESFLLRGVLKEKEPLAAARAIEAALWQRNQQVPSALVDKTAPLTLEVRYDSQVIPIPFTGTFHIPEPKEVQKVSFVIRRVAAADARLAVVLKVNGLNTLFRERLPDVQCHKWVLEPGVDSLTIDRVQTDITDDRSDVMLRAVAPSKPDEFRYGPDVGTVSLVVFREARGEETPPGGTDDLAAVARGAYPKDRADDLAGLKRALREEGAPENATHGLAAPVREGGEAREVRFMADPTPVMAVTITCQRP